MFIFDIVIPVYDEESTLVAQITKIVNYIKNDLSKYNGKFNLIIADNGSTDNTSALGNQLANEYDIVNYYKTNKPGVGLILKEVFSKSNADFIGFMDLDLSTDLIHLHEAINNLVYQNYDITYGDRMLKDSKLTGRSLIREFTSRSLNIILKLYLKTKITDTQCGFKFLKRGYIDTLIKKGAISDGWFFFTELLLISEATELKLKAIPIKWTDDPNSKVKVLKLAFEYLKAMKVLKPKLLKLRKS